MARKKENRVSGIYCWTSPCGKHYVGQSIDLNKRKLDFLKFHKKYTTETSKIESARKKYNNPDDWIYEILEECAWPDLNEREAFWIREKDSFQNGYNGTKGGDYIPNDDTRALSTLSEIGKAIWEREGFRDRTVKHMREARKKKEVIERYRNGTIEWMKTHDNPNFKRAVPKEIREKQSKVHMGKKPIGSMKPVVQLSEDFKFIKEWESCAAASIALNNAPNSHIHSVCKGHRNYAHGYRWLFKNDYEKIINGVPINEIYEFYKKNKNSNNKTYKVCQFSFDGDYIKTWNSLSEAGLNFGQPKGGSIACALSKKRETKTAYGYFWMRESEYIELKNKIGDSGVIDFIKNELNIKG